VEVYSQKVNYQQTLKVAYFAVLLDGPQSGAAKKVNEQIRIWRAAGIETELFVVTNATDRHIWADLEQTQVFTDSLGISKLLLRYKVLKKIFDSNPDLIYIRDSFPFILPRTKNHTGLILEVQSNVQAEVFKRSKIKGFLSIFLDQLFLEKIDAFVFVSSELSLTSRFRKFVTKSNHQVISNGIDLSKFEILPLPNKNFRQGIFFMGQGGQPWHGVNQIYDLAKQMQDFDFHIVGLSKPPGMEPTNVFHHGVLSQEEYLPIAAKCAAGIGSLNLISLGMREASPLKTRQYLAIGLPVISRYVDSDFGAESPFILSLPVGHESIAVHEADIRQFCTHWSDKRVDGEDVQVIDVNLKESNRLAFFKATASVKTGKSSS
jgi:glycosyltransferase involved in cell wall biosynthesis